MNLQDLKKEIPYKWKIQTKPKADKKGSCVAYIDSRDCQNVLDNICGQDKWQSSFYEVKGKVFCKVGIKINDEWVWKSDSGALDESEYVESETTSKGETSDAFKRACIQWGIGRFLYEKDIVWISDADYTANKYQLTDFCNSKNNKSLKESKIEPAKEKVWLNYQTFKEIVESGNTTEQQIAKVILEDGYSCSQYVKNAIRHYLSTGEIDKSLFFKLPQ